MPVILRGLATIDGEKYKEQSPNCALKDSTIICQACQGYAMKLVEAFNTIEQLSVMNLFVVNLYNKKTFGRIWLF